MRRGRTSQTRTAVGEAGPAVDIVFVLAAVLVLAAGLLGGASRENPLRLAAVELVATPLAAMAIRRLLRGETPLADSAWWSLVILGLIVAVPLLHLVPLPPALWAAAPGGASRLEALELAHLAPPWLPASLSPRDTIGAGLALIPPVAMLLATLGLTPAQARRLAGLWVILAVAGLVLGIAQIVAPAGSPAYLYRTTNYGSLVGLFANRNHEAGFLLAMAPFAAALAVPAARPPPGAGKAPPAPALAALFILFSVVALGVIRSRAGVILAAPAVLAALAVVWTSARRQNRWAPVVGLGAAAVLAAAAVSLFALTPILDRFAPQPTGEMRFEAWPYVAQAARAFLPFGSGLGSFDRVFEAVEPLSLVAPAYFNHAHNEYLELWLETGWIGASIFALFLGWFAVAAWRAWTRGEPLQRAASAAMLLLLAQSFVDYPLRTETLAVLFAFCCGRLAAKGPAG